MPILAMGEAFRWDHVELEWRFCSADYFTVYRLQGRLRPTFHDDCRGTKVTEHETAGDANERR
jgi:hypothetical protein